MSIETSAGGKPIRRGMCAGILSLEAIVLGLTTPVLIVIVDVDVAPALLVGVGLTVLCVLTAGMLRRPWAYSVGWAIQVAAVALGFVVSAMFVLGGIFALLWGMADFLGRRIERERAEAYAAWAAEQEPDPGV